MEGYGNENPGAFQSTRPLRGATSQPITKVELLGEFQPTRPLRGATYHGVHKVGDPKTFQPTRPLRGATYHGVHKVGDPKTFQPTRPLRGATLYGLLVFRSGFHISTHAPLAGRDWVRRSRRWLQRYFNPRAPCGARRVLSFEGGA